MFAIPSRFSTEIIRSAIDDESRQTNGLCNGTSKRNEPTTGATKATFPVLDPDFRPRIQGLFASALARRLYNLCKTCPEKSNEIGGEGQINEGWALGRLVVEKQVNRLAHRETGNRGHGAGAREEKSERRLLKPDDSHNSSGAGET